MFRMWYEARVFDMSGLKTMEDYTSMSKVELQGLDKEAPAAIIFSKE